MKQKEEDESSDLGEKQQNSLLKQQTVVPLTILCLCFMRLKWEETAFYKIKARNIQKQQHNMSTVGQKGRQHVHELCKLKGNESNMSIWA